MPGQKRAREDGAREGSAVSQASSAKEQSRSKKKSKHSDKGLSDAPPLTARSVFLAMLPTLKATSPTLRVGGSGAHGIQALQAGGQQKGQKPAKALIDHSVVALGTIAALKVMSSPIFTVTFALVAPPSPPVSGDAPATSALTENGGNRHQSHSLSHLPYTSFVSSSSLLPPDALEVTLSGDWAQQLCGNDLHSPVLKNGCTLALSFKQGKWDAKPHTSAQSTQYRTSSQWRLLFVRGCELWVARDESHAPAQQAAWIHSSTFAAALGRATSVSASASSESTESLKSDTQPSSTDGQNGSGPSNAPDSAQRAWTAISHRPQGKDITQEEPCEREKQERAELDRCLEQFEVERDAERMVQAAFLPGQSAPMLPATAASLQLNGHTDGMNNTPAQLHHLLVEPANPYQGGCPFAKYDTCAELRMRKGDTTTVNVFGVVDAPEGIVERPLRDVPYSSNFSLVDVSTPTELGDFIRVSVQGYQRAGLPEVNKGDVVLIQGIKTAAAYRTKLLAYLDNQPVWRVWTPPMLHGGLITSDHLNEAAIRSSRNAPPWISDDDKLQMVRLANWYQGAGQTAIPSQPSYSGATQYVTSAVPAGSWSVGGRPFKLLEALREPDGRADYFDCAVELVQELSRYDRGAFEYSACVTDYTTNEAFGDLYPDEASIVPNSVFQIDFDAGLTDEAKASIRLALDRVGNVVRINNIRNGRNNGTGGLQGRVGSRGKGFCITLLPDEHPLKQDLLKRKQDTLSRLHITAAGVNEEEHGNGADDSGFASSDDNAGPVKPTPARPAPVRDPSIKVSPTSGSLPPTPAAQPIKQPTTSALSNRPPSTATITHLRSTRVKKLCDVDCPSKVGPVFDLYCEVLEIGFVGTSVQLCVTDFTTHQNLRSFSFGNASFEHVAFEVTVWGDAHAEKLEGVEPGDRILLEVVAPKVGRWENQFAKNGDTRLLEGQVGDKYKNFKVTKLDKNHPEYQVLSRAQEALGVIVKEEEADSEPDATRQAAAKQSHMTSVLCRHSDVPEESARFIRRHMSGEDERYRLRGRVLATEPANLDHLLLAVCRRCETELVRGASLCSTCPDSLQKSNLEYEWSFALTMEIEQEGCEIFGLPPDTDYSLHVHVAERSGETTFLNDLEPSPANLAEAASLIRKLMYRPDEAAHSGPVFDFCISWMGSERVAFISQTAIMREGRHIKWYDEE